MTGLLTCVVRLREIESSIPGSVRSYTALLPVRHRFNTYQVAVLSWRYVTELAPLLMASVASA